MKILIAIVLVMATTLTALPDRKVEAKVAHELYSVEYETVYYDPRDKEAEWGFLVAILSLHPALSKMKKLSALLSFLGLKKAYQAIEKAKKKKPDTRFVIEKKVYKAKRTTANYWGYHKTNILDTSTRIKYYGKAMTIGKTAY